MEDQFSKFVEKKQITVDTRAYSIALDRVRGLVTPRPSHPYSLVEAVDSLPGSSSAGYPYLSKRATVKARIISDAKSLKRQIARNNAHVFPCMASSRRVIREIPKNKPRLVWAYPGAVSCLEQRFYLPISKWIATFAQHGTSIQWLDRFRWFQRLNDNPYKCNAIVTTDFTSFDSSVPAFMIRDAFDILREHFILNAEEEKEWKFLVDYFIHTPLMMYGTVRQKHRGIPSGSCFTSIIGTLVNMIACYYVAEKADFEIRHQTSKWLGDDSRQVIAGHRTGRHEDVLSDYAKYCGHLGMSVSPDKSDYTIYEFANEEKDYYFGSFLSRKIHRSYPPLRFDKLKFMGQLLIPEERDRSPSMTLDRIIGLAYAYGFDKGCHRMLAAAYDHVVLRYPSRPSFDPRIVAKYNRFLHTEFTVDEWKFPSFEEIHTLYFGYA